MRTRYFALQAALIAIVACGESESRTDAVRDGAAHDGSAFDAAWFDGEGDADAAAQGDELRPAFCARDGEDEVRDAFCTGDVPTIRSLRELQVLFGLRPAEDPPPPPPPTSGQQPTGALLTTIAVLGHSTALSGHLVSTINPRVIMLGGSTIAAFQRGEQRVELISRARDRGSLNFYLLSFTQACNEAEHGCAPGDLYTPRIESDWSIVEIRDGEELKNTPADCRSCHQRASDVPRLLMRELQSPWTHFLFPAGLASMAPGITGADLMDDYLLAKDNEPYAGFYLHTISPVTPFTLETTVGREQPLLFDAPAIENERYPYGPDGYPTEPLASPTWEAAYQAFKRGEQLALPYVETRVPDPDKQAALSEAYQRYLKNEISAEELPDLSDIFPDDPMERALRGLQTEPDGSPEDTLIQACGSCHNDVLDQSISRALFNISVSRMDRYELDEAIERMQRPPGTEGVMPPREARQLDPSARERLIEYLRQDPATLDADGRLENAARLGMKGGAGSSPPGAGFGI